MTFLHGCTPYHGDFVPADFATTEVVNGASLTVGAKGCP